MTEGQWATVDDGIEILEVPTPKTPEVLNAIVDQLHAIDDSAELNEALNALNLTFEDREFVKEALMNRFIEAVAAQARQLDEEMQELREKELETASENLTLKGELKILKRKYNQLKKQKEPKKCACQEGESTDEC